MEQAVPKRENRYSARLNVKVDARLREVASKSRFEVQIDDLSLTGFRCTTGFSLTPDNIVTLAFPGLTPLEAQVIWASGKRYGCQFEHPLHVAVFDHLVALYRPKS